MWIDKLIITVNGTDNKEEKIEVLNIEHNNPDVQAVLEAENRVWTAVSIKVDVGDDTVASALGRLRWGRSVGLREKRSGVEEVETGTDRINPNLNLKIEEMELPTLSHNALQNAGYIYVWQVAKKTENDLMKTKNFGRKSLNCVREWLDMNSLWLGMKFSEELRALLIQPE